MPRYINHNGIAIDYCWECWEYELEACYIYDDKMEGTEIPEKHKPYTNETCHICNKNLVEDNKELLF